MRSVALLFLAILCVTSAAWAQSAQRQADAPENSPLAEPTDADLEKAADPYRPLVRAFFDYDVGQLRGPAAGQAVRAWRRLDDPAAIPAVVEGLNVALRTGASCPVLEFSAKLRDLLRRADNPAYGTYVLRHLRPGTGRYRAAVSRVLKAAEQQVLRTKMRQYGRLQLLQRMRKRSSSVVAGEPSLLESILATRPGERRTSQAQDGTEDRGRQGVEELVRGLQAGQLSKPELRRLELSLRGAEAGAHAEQIRALMTVAARASLPVSHRRTAIRILGKLRVRQAVPLLIDIVAHEDAELRDEAATALTRITRKLFGPPPGAKPHEVQAAVEKWRQWWEQQSGAQAVDQ